MEKGKFITVEGIDGSGKTSVVLSAKKQLGDNFAFTKDPGGSEFCDKIKELTLSNYNKIYKKMSLLMELTLFTADRVKHLIDVIVPFLQEGNHILCDRYIDSTLAYQLYGRKIDHNFAKTMKELSKSYLNKNGEIQKIEPDKTIFLDITPEELVKRNHKQLSGNNRIDSADIELQRKIYEGYLKEIKNDKSNRFVVVNARNDKEEVEKDVLNVIKSITRK